jgi:cytochrome c553
MVTCVSPCQKPAHGNSPVCASQTRLSCCAASFFSLTPALPDTLNGRLYSPQPSASDETGRAQISEHDMTRPLLSAACFALLLAGVIPASQARQDAKEPAAPPSSAPAPETPAAAPAPAAPAAAKANLEIGKQLSYTCQGCHGVTGYKNAYPNYHVPRIGGQTSEYLVQALTEYKAGKRKHPTMQAQAQSFSDQDITDLAAYLSSLK